MAILNADRWLDRLGFLDPLAEAYQKRMAAWLTRGGAGARAAKDVLNGTWLGHPLHPALTDLPLGAWSGSMLLDLVGEEVAADLLLGLGCVAGTAAAAAGLADWQDSYGQERRVGAAHGLLNLAALGAMASALVLRRAGRRGWARPLALGGYGLAAASGYLGGHLVFRLGTQVNRNAFVEGPSEWQVAGDEELVVEGALVASQVGATRILLTRVDGRLCALSNVCSHAGGPLAEGDLAQGVVRCPWHGSRFDVRTGAVVEGPATAPLPTYATRVNATGEVEVRAG